VNTEKALEIVMDIAARWGENAEEQFPSRIKADDTDATLAEYARQPDGEVDEVELEDATTIRDLWRALETLHRVVQQRGCETFDSGVTDGKLTTLCDIAVFG
jgi:hypothetical protein